MGKCSRGVAYTTEVVSHKDITICLECPFDRCELDIHNALSRRKRATNIEKVSQLLKDNYSTKDIATKLQVDIRTVQRYIRIMKDEK